MLGCVERAFLSVNQQITLFRTSKDRAHAAPLRGHGALVVRLWCACGALVVRLWCACGALVVRLWCACGALVVRLWCACGALVVRLWCACDALGMHLGCTWDALGMHLGCTWDALGMHLRCTCGAVRNAPWPAAISRLCSDVMASRLQQFPRDEQALLDSGRIRLARFAAPNRPDSVRGLSTNRGNT
jgi:hypothetical protein